MWAWYTEDADIVPIPGQRTKSRYGRNRCSVGLVKRPVGSHHPAVSCGQSGPERIYNGFVGYERIEVLSRLIFTDLTDGVSDVFPGTQSNGPLPKSHSERT